MEGQLRTEKTARSTTPLMYTGPAGYDAETATSQLLSANLDSVATNHFEIPSAVTAALSQPRRMRKRTPRPKSRRVPVGSEQRRAAFRVDVTLAAMAEWSAGCRTALKKPAVVQNLSGEGANILMSELPARDRITLSLIPPEGFVVERLQQGLKKDELSVSSRWIPAETDVWQRDQLRYQLGPIEARVVRASLPEDSAPDDSYKRLSLEFLEPHEGCFRLVRYVERRPVYGKAHNLT